MGIEVKAVLPYSKYPLAALILVRLLAGAVLMYLLITIFLVLYQDQLVFIRQGIGEERLTGLRESGVPLREMEIMSDDEVILHGWWVNGPDILDNVSENGLKPLVLYFGGNAEEVSHMIMEAASFPEWSFLLMNYRGYGLSGGNPSEEALLSDALAIYDDLTNRGMLNPETTIVMGRSLGTGVAIHLAYHRDLRGAVFVSPYDSMRQVAADAYPFLPVKWLMRHRFEVIDMASEINIPLHALIALEDEVIDPKRSRALLNAWGGSVHLTEVPQARHNTLMATAAYQDFVEKSLRDLKP